MMAASALGVRRGFDGLAPGLAKSTIMAIAATSLSMRYNADRLQARNRDHCRR